MQIAICGGGNAAHTLVGLLAAQPELAVNVYSPLSNEVELWRQGVEAFGGIAVVFPEHTLMGRPHIISDDPAAVVPGSQMVLLALPAFAHEIILKDIAPYLDEDAWVGALPARGGFDWCVDDLFGSSGKSVRVFGLQTLPWACRIRRYGREVVVLGTKEAVDIAAWPGKQVEEIAASLSDLLDIPMCPIRNFLSLSLAGTGQLIHPGVMYGLFHNWDGRAYEAAPLFYHSVDEQTADVLRRLSDEVQSLCVVLESRFPSLDLSGVRPLHEWIIYSYDKAIADPSSLRSSFATNRGYAGLQAPMRPAAGGLAPDFESRYLTEDVPYGLVVMRGIAELAAVATPMMDEVIVWAQDRVGKEYLVDGKLAGRDITDTRAPQRYGMDTLDALVPRYL